MPALEGPHRVDQRRIVGRRCGRGAGRREVAQRAQPLGEQRQAAPGLTRIEASGTCARGAGQRRQRLRPGRMVGQPPIGGQRVHQLAIQRQRRRGRRHRAGQRPSIASQSEHRRGVEPGAWGDTEAVVDRSRVDAAEGEVGEHRPQCHRQRRSELARRLRAAGPRRLRRREQGGQRVGAVVAGIEPVVAGRGENRHRLAGQRARPVTDDPPIRVGTGQRPG